MTQSVCDSSTKQSCHENIKILCLCGITESGLRLELFQLHLVKLSFYFSAAGFLEDDCPI